MSASRAAAAARRSRRDMSGVVRLPNVPMSYGVNCVSAMTIRMESIGTRSSSATAWVSEVRMFCPTSALPVKTAIRPSSPMCSQAPMSWGAAPPPKPPPRRPPGCCAAASGASRSSR